ncbi:MAG: hypothetical protein D3910_05710 [Candidatus Electrothrix sp. ATG2]|nr:hypothetical protein [Candidatus Electrothrix sp. ATG2]
MRTGRYNCFFHACLAKMHQPDLLSQISNAASQGVRSPLTVETENVALENGRLVIVHQSNEQFRAKAVVRLLGFLPSIS